jgi:hypothetical protein
MTAGLQIFSSSNHIQVDPDYRNLTLRYSGSIQSLPNSPAYYPPGYRFYTLTATCENPVLAIHPGAATVIHYSTSVSGGTFTFSILATGVNAASRYYVFDNPQSIASSGGLEIFTLSGQLAFSSSHKYMRVVTLDPTTPFAVPSSKTYALVVNNIGGYVTDETTDTGGQGQFIRHFYRDFVRMSGNNLVLDQVETGFVTYSNQGYGEPDLSVPSHSMILDVTNF